MLLCLLAITLLSALLIEHPFSARSMRSDTAAQPTSSPCGASIPRLSILSTQSLDTIRASLARLPRRGSVADERGSISTLNVWSDGSPVPVSRSPPHVPGAYEVRWWTPHGSYHAAADGFLFASSSAAQRFAGVAARAACHAHGSEEPIQTPSGALALTWSNPDDAREADVILARGRYVYRLVMVPAAHRGAPPEDGPQAMARATRIAELFACLLPGVSCTNAPPQSSLRQTVSVASSAPELEFAAQPASAAEAAAIVAAIERFRADTMPSGAAEPANQQDRWTQTAILEGVRREDTSSWAWGDPSQME